MKFFIACLVIALVTARPETSNRSDKRHRKVDSSEEPVNSYNYGQDTVKNHETLFPAWFSSSSSEEEPLISDLFIEFPDYSDSKDTQQKVTEYRSVECSLEGTWYNEHGSELILSRHDDSRLSGEYRTGVETQEGSAGKIAGVVHGTSTPYSRTFGFSVSWNEGESITSWTGQCFKCNGKEILEVTWVLTSAVDKCRDAWLANRIGQGTFTRYEQAPGPRKALEIHTPLNAARD